MPSITIQPFAAQDFSITDFGAKEGVKATDAFAAAMAACEKAGGGRVVVPKGKWLTGAVHFRNNCNLHLAKGATLEFTDDPADYLPAVHTTWEGVECLNYSPLLYAYGVTNVAITGKGTVAPRMGFWRTWFARPPEHMKATECLYHWCSTNAPMFARDVTAIKGSNVRPHLIQFNRCKDVLLDGFRIRESPFWMIHLYHSENCIVRNLDTYAHGHNNDGVDIEMTRNVLVENCRFDQGDDGIVLKAGRNQDAWRLNRPTENVVVRNCEFVFAHTLLGIGSELSGGIRNVWMHHCRLATAFNLFYVKTNRRRGGFVKDIYFEDIESDNVRSAVVGVETDVLYQWAKFPDYELRPTEIGGLHIRNVKANCADYAIDIRGAEASPVRKIELENVWVGSCRKAFERVENAEEIHKRNVRLGDLKPRPWVQQVDETRNRKPVAVPWVSDAEREAVTRIDPVRQESVKEAGKVVAVKMNTNETAYITVNYDESKAGVLGKDYKIPDPLTFADGRKVANAADWSERRKEMLGIFEREIYGRMPPKPDVMTFEIVSEKTTEDRFAEERRYRQWFRADKTGPCIDWIVFVPRYAKKPCPVILHLNYKGNDFTASGRTSHFLLPLGEFTARGYAFMSAHYTQITSDGPDRGGEAFNGVFELWGRRDPARTDNTGSLMAWAWGLCRGLDLAERIGEIDAGRSAVVGSSRLGKAALLAAAFDERFKVCVANQTGAIGVQLMKRDFGENLATQRRMFPWWYCSGAWKWTGREKEMPFDQHMLLACVAPRALLIEGFDKDWFDPRGEWLSVKAASSVWEFLSGKGLECDDWPEPYDGNVAKPPLGYARRTEEHGLSAYDWHWALDFADKAL